MLGKDEQCNLLQGRIVLGMSKAGSTSQDIAM